MKKNKNKNLKNILGIYPCDTRYYLGCKMTNIPIPKIDAITEKQKNKRFGKRAFERVGRFFILLSPLYDNDPVTLSQYHTSQSSNQLDPNPNSLLSCFFVIPNSSLRIPNCEWWKSSVIG